jgi:DNA-binding MarR family transcriptional regulator
MADINSQSCDPPAASRRPRADALRQDDLYWFVEAFFFAYRDFIGDPDRILDEIGFGRAHHRVLHFIHRYPGMRVADLLDILRITKQSLARVLRELIKEGYVAQHSGTSDRRERLLYVTDSGGALAERLAAPQIEKMRAALGPLGRDRDAVRRFLDAMIGDAARVPRTGL